MISILDTVDVRTSSGPPVLGAIVVGRTFSDPVWVDVMTKEGAVLKNIPEDHCTLARPRVPRLEEVLR